MKFREARKDSGGKTAAAWKEWFAYRIAVDGLSMLNFVCGTLFGFGSPDAEVSAV